MMLLNSDFSQRTIITPDDYQWVPSPQPGVERVMLDRIGHEQARATSLVRYAPGSEFPAHSHPGGEEILVLDGTFTENGIDHPAGWYLRSPDGSSHQPSSRDGTTIFVKLRQMSADESQPVRINTQEAANWHGQPQRQVCPLFTGTLETVLLQKVAPGERIFCAPLVGGAELFLLKGQLGAPDGCYEAGSWLRFPPGDMPALMATASGALFYLKKEMKKTLTKAELITLLQQYPDDAKIVLSVMESDIAKVEPVDMAGESVREFGLPGDRTYDDDENVLALCVW